MLSLVTHQALPRQQILQMPHEQLWRTVRVQPGRFQPWEDTQAKPQFSQPWDTAATAHCPLSHFQELPECRGALRHRGPPQDGVGSGQAPAGLGRPGTFQPSCARGARAQPRAGALLGAALKCMSCAGPNDEQSCQTRSLSQLIISNEGRVSGSPRSRAAASHSAQLQQREKITKCHCAAQSLIRQI